MPETKPFCHLHVHTEYSLLDGMNRIPALMQQVKDQGMKHVGISDHGNMFGAMQFVKEAEKRDIKPIIGCELYLSPTTRDDRSLPAKQAYNHILAIAQTQEGYQNLCRLTSLGYMEGFYYKPRIDFDLLEQYGKGLIFTSGCLKGVVPQLLVHDAPQAQVDKALDRFVQIAGRENFFIELQNHGIQEQLDVNPGLLRAAKRHKLPLLATNDTHYLCRGGHKVQEVLLCINTGKNMRDEGRMKFDSEEFYVKSPDEMWRLFGELPESLTNSVEIAERCEATIPFGQKLYPKFQPPDGSTDKEYLRHLCFEGLKERYGEPSDAHIERMERELDIVDRMGYNSYFLVVWDFIRFARERGIPVGPGRGSAAGSIVAYCLRITNLDPIKYGLLFERFLNPERVSPPDIDIDFCKDRRGEVIEYVREKYGKDCVAQIITFSRMMAKNSVRDVARVMGHPIPLADQICKLISKVPNINGKPPTIDQALAGEPDLQKLCGENPNAKQIIDYARQVEGFARNAGTHAAGVVISDRPLTDIIPVYAAQQDDSLITQWTMSEVEDLGLLKMDFLGLKNLTIIDFAIKKVKLTRGIDIDIEAIPLDDEKTFHLLQQGDTLGIFQLESSGMRDWLRRLAPTTFDDIIAMLALYRPGPLESGMVQQYIDAKHERIQVEYDHPDLETILGETHGVILYQEQVTKIANVLSGFTLGQGDILRRAMGKKKIKEMGRQKKNFVEGAKKNNVDEKLASSLFDKIEKFAGYGFNKSHSAAYALVTYQTAWLKANYPVEYFSALLSTTSKTDQDKLARFMEEARARGIEILPPDVNESFVDFTVTPQQSIRFGLGSIKTVGANLVEAIITEREKGGRFESFEDFCLRIDHSCLNSRMVDALIKAGALDSVGAYRSQMVSICSRVLELTAVRQRAQRQGQHSIFDAVLNGGGGNGNGNGQSANSVPLPLIGEVQSREKAAWEKEFIGFYISSHPLDAYRLEWNSFATLHLDNLENCQDGQSVRVVGLVSNITEKLDKKNNPMAWVTVEDFTGSAEVIFFSSAWEKCREAIALDEAVVIAGRANVRELNESNKDAKIIANKASPATSLKTRGTDHLRVCISRENASEENIKDLKAFIFQHKGKMPVYLALEEGGCGMVTIKPGQPMKINPADGVLKELQELASRPRLHLVPKEARNNGRNR